MLEGYVHSISWKFNLHSEQLRIFLMNFETLIKALNRNILTPLYLKSEIFAHESLHLESHTIHKFPDMIWIWNLTSRCG